MHKLHLSLKFLERACSRIPLAMRNRDLLQLIFSQRLYPSCLKIDLRPCPYPHYELLQRT